MSIKHTAGQLVAATIVTLGLAGVGAPSAHAESLSRSTTVRFDDLNLASDAGARALYARILSAAREVCGSDGWVVDRAERAVLQACVAESTRRAVVNVNAPSLNALYSRQTGALFQPKS